MDYREDALTDHLDIEKLKKLMFSQMQLTEEEDRHLFHCAECKQNMVQATLDQLPSESESREKKPGD